MKSIIISTLVGIAITGPGAAFFLFILKKFIDREKLGTICFKCGAWLTKSGSSKFGKAFWEPVEDYLIDTTEWILFNIKSGANSDDSNGNGNGNGNSGNGDEKTPAFKPMVKETSNVK